jgi:hypothetical protein
LSTIISAFKDGKTSRSKRIFCSRTVSSDINSRSMRYLRALAMQQVTRCSSRAEIATTSTDTTTKSLRNYSL